MNTKEFRKQLKEATDIPHVVFYRGPFCFDVSIRKQYRVEMREILKQFNCADLTEYGDSNSDFCIFCVRVGV